ncbi:MAG: aldo/keto reductase [Spirochaetales bacterium]|nr:aldo/keto reductase [Spirochaetales bacterium]
MEYRRFGKTEKEVSVITLGGMRFTKGWEKPKNEIPRETLDNAIFSLKRALDGGINLIETAYGYMKSEHAMGMAFKELAVPRDNYFLMTKGNPATAEEVRPLIEEQLEVLGTDHFDFYAWHGLNNRALLDSSCATGGAVEELLKLKEEGLIGHVGFSSHGRVEVISDAIRTDLFEFVNLHYYYFFQRNRAAIDLAELKDMGVFIISPNDKGGQLYKAPPLLRSLTEPYTPIQWNARFCLGTPAVHTLSFGITEESHFKEMEGLFPLSLPLPRLDREIQCRLDQRYLEDPYSSFEGYGQQEDPTGINIPEFLRLRSLWKCFDMTEFARYRYNGHSPDDHWVTGSLAFPELVEKVDVSRVPEGVDLKALLHETHEHLYVPKEEKKD